jgi:hypothetical protein
MKIMRIACDLCKSERSADNPVGGFIIEDDRVKMVTCERAIFHLCESCIQGIVDSGPLRLK